MFPARLDPTGPKMRHCEQDYFGTQRGRSENLAQQRHFVGSGSPPNAFSAASASSRLRTPTTFMSPA